MTGPEDTAGAATTAEPRSNGLGWAGVMLGLEVVELLVVVEMLTTDRDAVGVEHANPFLLTYLVVLVATVVVEAAGMVLVKLGRYRLGGALQIAASVPQVLKGDGVIGIIGGLKAWRYPAEPAPPLVTPTPQVTGQGA